MTHRSLVRIQPPQPLSLPAHPRVNPCTRRSKIDHRQILATRTTGFEAVTDLVRRELCYPWDTGGMYAVELYARELSSSRAASGRSTGV